MAGSDEVRVLLNGIPFEGWKTVSHSNNFEETTGEAQLTISEQPGDPLPADIGDECQIILAGKPVLTGFIKSVEGSLEWGSHEINLTAKDKTDDLIKSTIGPKLEVKAPIDLKKVAEKTIKHMGLDIKVIDKVSPEVFKQGEVVFGDIEDRGQYFLDNWAKKRGVVLNTNGKGDLILNQNQKEMSKYKLNSGPEGGVNNVLSSSYSNSEEGRSSEYNTSGQKSPNDKDFWESRPKSDPLGSAKSMATNWGKAIDSAIRPQLKLHFRGRKGMQGKTPEESAKWAANVNRARGFTYKCKVQGFTQGLGGDLWWPGLLVAVSDWHWNIDHILFLKSVAFSKTWGEGATTDLEFTVEDAYSPQAEPNGEQNRNKKKPLGDSPKGKFTPDYNANRYDPDTGVRRIKGR